MRRVLTMLTAAFGSLLSTGLAHAHFSVTGPAYAGANFEGAFNVGHGCEGLDTYSATIQIPAGITGVRVVEHGVFTTATLVRDEANNVTAVTFTKPQAAVRAADDAFYKLVVRMRAPNTPFAKLHFPVTQVCRSQDGNTETITEWDGIDEAPGGADEPAPSLTVLPARTPGWNKYTATERLTDLPALFKDALIVWAGEAAYSVNPNTAALIESEEGVTLLDAIEANTEFWVKY